MAGHFPLARALTMLAVLNWDFTHMRQMLTYPLTGHLVSTATVTDQDYPRRRHVRTEESKLKTSDGGEGAKT